MKELYSQSYIAIYHDGANGWLYIDWSGYQTEQTVKQGCGQILELMVEHRVFDILNDNTRVLGTWIEAAEWGAREWFPAMQRAGLRSFAWVYSRSLASQDATDASLEGLSRDEMGVHVFYSLQNAREWLQHRKSSMTKTD